MKCKLLRSVGATILALAVLAGCQSTPVLVEEAPDRDTDQVKIIIADSPEIQWSTPEYPAITADVRLPGGEAVADKVQTVATVSASDEVRAIWFSYLEMANLLTGKTEAQFTQSIGTAFDNVKSYGLNTVIVHVRPFGDALYDSDYFPWSYTATGTEGKNPGYDPLQIMIDAARERNLRIEAWLNPYRVRAAGNDKALSSDNQAQKWLDNNNSAVIRYNGAITYNPASQKAQELIVNGAVEIVRKYDVDGIHIDDYFYPTTDAAFDSASYNSYKNGGGNKSLADWRRSNVESLIKKMYTAIKAEDASVQFGIAPQSSIDNNYDTQYLDVKKIAANDGYCDYICPQIYFGYENVTQPYLKTLKTWNEMTTAPSVKLYVGLAAYKIGATDSWAGAGRSEWVQNTDLMSSMVKDARSQSNYQGFVLYRYDSVFKPDNGVKTSVQKENSNLRSIL